jgi:hypothetical protein
MGVVRDRWLSKRAVSLHVAVLLIVPGCAVAAWWQVNRAQDGNNLSYVYSVMWPLFGLLGLCFWWMLIHTDYETVGLKGMRRQEALAQGPAHAPSGTAEATDVVSTSPALPLNVMEASIVTETTPVPAAADEDPELAAYNARLAALEAKGPKTWRNRETVVVRRSR